MLSGRNEHQMYAKSVRNKQDYYIGPNGSDILEIGKLPNNFVPPIQGFCIRTRPSYLVIFFLDFDVTCILKEFIFDRLDFSNWKSDICCNTK